MIGTIFSELDRLADENWHWLKNAAGLPEDGWEIIPLARRDDPHQSSTTQRATHTTLGSFTYKFQLRPNAPEGFARHFRLQQTAYEAFPHSPAFTLPRPIFVDEARQVSLLTHIKGAPVSEAIRHCRNDKEQLSLLTRCGAWLDAFHRSQPHESRNFQPGHTLRYYHGRKRQIETGEEQVAVPSLYLRGIDKLDAVAARVAGRPTTAAMQHGDFHLRNLILDGPQIAGIDVSKDHMAPVGYDIAKILLDFTTVFRSSDALENGQIIHPETMEAFFKGYRLVGPDDPSVTLLLYARILATLNTVQARQSQRTDAKQRTLERLRPFARTAFRPDSRRKQKSTDRPITFLLTRKSVEAARQGNHSVVNAFRQAVEPLGLKVLVRRNTPQNLRKLEANDLSLVHMSDPVGPNGLVFRRAYAGPFWHLETKSARWNWSIAKQSFIPEEIDPDAAAAFFEKWRTQLLPSPAQGETGDFIYMPLQGKLLQQRSFQSTSPIEMITQTLAHTDLPIRATLHPSETYCEAERAALDEIASKEARFQLVTLPMHEALARCRFVVTENSSAAFHAVLYEKPSVLFAGIDFHHIARSWTPDAPARAFEALTPETFPFRAYLYWYWALHCIELGAPNEADALRARVAELGWTLPKAS